MVFGHVIHFAKRYTELPKHEWDAFIPRLQTHIRLVADEPTKRSTSCFCLGRQTCKRSNSNAIWKAWSRNLRRSENISCSRTLLTAPQLRSNSLDTFSQRRSVMILHFIHACNAWLLFQMVEGVRQALRESVKSNERRAQMVQNLNPNSR